MSVNLKSLGIVIDLATRLRDEAGTMVAAAMRDLTQATQQLQQLTDYANDGEAKWRARAAEGVTVALMQHQRAFAEKIQQAVDFQVNVIKQKETALDATRRHLQEKEQALATLKKVAERTRLAQQVAQHKRSQKQTDEMAMSMLAYQRRENEQEFLI
jgi:flagellar FliJ protein